MRYLFWLLPWFLLMSTCAATCSTKLPPPPPPNPDATITPSEVFTLQLLHASDGQARPANVDDIPRFSAVVETLRERMPNATLLLSAGDNYVSGAVAGAATSAELVPVLGVPGPHRMDIAWMNAIGFQASSFGHHEFDPGPGALAAVLAPDGAYPGASFPFLAVNVDFSNDSSLAPLVALDDQLLTNLEPSHGRIAGTVRVPFGNEEVGVIGAVTPLLAQLSEPGPDLAILPPSAGETDLPVASIQRAVDALVAAGLNKIIVVSHLQRLGLELALASQLEGVDIIVAGGSGQVLADGNDRLRAGDTSQGTYPEIRQSASDEPVAIVSTSGSWRYVGRLVASFDRQGILLTDQFDEEEDGIYATDAQGVADLGASPIDEVVDLTTAFTTVLGRIDGTLTGATSVWLNGQSDAVAIEETNLGDLVADAMLWYVRQVEPDAKVALTNGSRIQASIGSVELPPSALSRDREVRNPPDANPSAGKLAGDISQLDIEMALPLEDELVVLELTPEELLGVLKHAISGDLTQPRPQFPQIAGLRMSFDPLFPEAERVRSVALVSASGMVDPVVMGGRVSANAPNPIKVVSTRFLATLVNGVGGEGYPFPSEAVAPRTLVSTTNLGPGSMTFADPGSMVDAVAEYLFQVFPRSRPFGESDQAAVLDTRIQNLDIVQMDTVFR